jgi:predicted nucleic acid-binding protein
VVATALRALGDCRLWRRARRLLTRIDLRPVDRSTADLATALASKYGLRAADATHLATAVGLGAERFISNNQRDFPQAITEVNVTYPPDLTDATGA